jgi:hypothetical protein
MDGCHHNQAASCSALAQVQATPFPGEDAPSAYGAHQAGLSWLHACDLGDAGACAAAVSVLAPHRPLHAVLLARRACAAGVTAACTPDRALTSRAARTRTLFDVTLAPGDEPFDIRFATLFDGDETELIWIASHDPPTTVERRLAPSIARGTVRVEPPDTLASAPTWARSIYFVGAPPTSPYAEPCRPCPHPPSAFSITRCICLP